MVMSARANITLKMTMRKFDNAPLKLISSAYGEDHPFALNGTS